MPIPEDHDKLLNPSRCRKDRALMISLRELADKLRDELVEFVKKSGPPLVGAQQHVPDLRGVWLYRANFATLDDDGTRNKAEANRTRGTGHASLFNADLSMAILKKAELRGVCLEKTTLAKAQLQQANLERADLRDAKLGYANLEEANLTGANLMLSQLEGTVFTAATLTNAILQSGALSTMLDFTPPAAARLRHKSAAGLFDTLRRGAYKGLMPAEDSDGDDRADGDSDDDDGDDDDTDDGDGEEEDEANWMEAAAAVVESFTKVASPLLAFIEGFVRQVQTACAH